MRRFLLVPTIFILFLVYAMVNRAGSIRTWFDLHRDLETGAARIGQLQEENQDLREAIVAFEGDSIAVERVLREELELARPGEVVVKLPEPED